MSVDDVRSSLIEELQRFLMFFNTETHHLIIAIESMNSKTMNLFEESLRNLIVSFLDCENSKLTSFEDIRHSHLLTIYENNPKALSCRSAVNES